MTIDVEDPGCVAALAAQLGHAAPFDDAELASISSLTITHARDLSMIRACSGLRHLRLIACELPDLDVVEGMTELAHIEVFCSLFQTLGGSSYLDHLERFDVLFTSVEDASAVVGTTRSRGALIGNPWNEASWDALEEDAMRDDMVVELTSRYEWQLTKRLWQQVGLCAGTLAGIYPLVVRPGLPKLTENVYDALQIAPGTAASDLKQPGASVEELFRQRADRIGAPDLAALLRNRRLGTPEDAVRWIATSGLSPEDKADAERFVRRFSGLKFFASSEAVIDRFAAMYQLVPPRNLRTMTTILDGWLAPHERPPVRFDRFAGPSPREDAVREIPYIIQLSDYSTDAPIRAAIRDAGFVIIARAIGHTSMLALRTDDRDSQIYEFDEQDIDSAVIAKRDVTSSIYPVFRSYAAMLSHISSVDPPGAPSIPAAEATG